jgi:nicotinate-nucleotide adenylyltransferase
VRVRARGGASYTVATLDELHALRPDIELTLILGSDMARTLSSWRSPARILALARIAVAARAGEPLPATGLTSIDAHATQPLPLQLPPVPISSSLVRERVADGGEVGGLVGSVIADYIVRHGLYRAGHDARVGGAGTVAR